MANYTKGPLSRIGLLVATTLACHAPLATAADDDTQRQIRALKEQVETLMRKVDELQRKADAPKERPAAAAPSTSVAGALRTFIQESTFYGNLDVSVDYTTKGIAGFIANNGTDRPVGRMGWVPAISTNLSYLGIRGAHNLQPDLNFIYQLEAQLDISATPGTVNTNSNNDSIVKGALFARDTFIGLGGQWGSVKIGKGDAPYKKSTGRLNPFLATVGDYAAIMGNTGGDNRVEFGTRFDHALWYESPNFSGFSFSALVSPGQNRARDNSIQAIGESSCAGGNVPGSGALPYGCNDGAFGDAYSFSGAFESGPLYLTAAYEMHRDVNRTSDSDGTVVMVNGVNYAFDQSVGIGDEWAWKVGAQYRFPTATTVGGAYEDIKRKLPFHYFDERSRKAYWLLVSQQLDKSNVFHFGYGHAKASPGATGQHNINSGPNQDNASNMYTGMYRHNFDARTSYYVVYATQINHSAGHYDLGAGGRANTTDCHDASQIGAFDLSTGTYVPGGPFCYVGGKLQAVSLGLNYRF